MMMTTRRQLLRLMVGGALPALAASSAAGQDQPVAGQGETGALRDPASAGRSRERITPLDNDEYIKQVEHRLQCTCGCTLDIYTCRTTDFTCTYSPALHREIVAMREEGKDADAIIAAFVAKYGEKVLMAPKPEGFNLAGYLVPGTVVVLAGGVMAALMLRRSRAMAAASAAPAVLAAAETTGAPAGASTEEMERLRRELREFDQ